jgi:hypothetical protein
MTWGGWQGGEGDPLLCQKCRRWIVYCQAIYFALQLMEFLIRGWYENLAGRAIRIPGAVVKDLLAPSRQGRNLPWSYRI